MEGNGRPRLAMPGQVNIGVESVPAAFASPVTLQLNLPDGFKAIAFGGLTKEEALAAPIYAQLCADVEDNEENAANIEAILAGLAEQALAMAECLLVASARRQQARAEAASKPKIEGA